MDPVSPRPNDEEFRAVLIYDGDCPFCSAASTALRRLRGVGVVPWNAAATQSFLDAQFGGTPFAFFSVDSDEGRVYAGRAAAAELTERAGLPALAADLVGDNYESIADALQNVSGLDREPDPYHDVHTLTERARDRFDALAESAESTSVVLDY